MLSALLAALDQLRMNRAIRVVVLAGAGRAFCADHDLREMRAHLDKAWLTELFTQCSKLMLTIVDIAQPVIACIYGLATAAGCQLVAACDLAIASRSSRFTTNGVNLDLFCSTPAVAIAGSVAPKRAAELLFGGDFITAEQAERWGLVNRCVAEPALAQATRDWAQAIAAKSGAAIMSGKTLLRKQRNLSLADAYAVAGENTAHDMLTENANMGIDAFLNKQLLSEWTHR